MSPVVSREDHQGSRGGASYCVRLRARRCARRETVVSDYLDVFEIYFTWYEAFGLFTLFHKYILIQNYSFGELSIAVSHVYLRPIWFGR